MRNCLTEYAAIKIYKQTILPVVVLRTDVIYKNIKMMHHDYVRIEDLYSRCKIISLEQRRRNQLLLLMYKKSKDVTMHKFFSWQYY